MPRTLLIVAALIGLLEWVASPARAQGSPPFVLPAPGSAAQSVVIVPSAAQDDGTHEIEVFPTN